MFFHVEIPERERSKKKQNPIVWPLLFCKSKKTPIGILGRSNGFSNVTFNNNSPIAFLKQKYHPFKNIQTILVTIYQTKKYNHLKFATRNKNLEIRVIPSNMTVKQVKTPSFQIRKPLMIYWIPAHRSLQFRIFIFYQCLAGKFGKTLPTLLVSQFSIVVVVGNSGRFILKEEFWMKCFPNKKLQVFFKSSNGVDKI